MRKSFPTGRPRTEVVLRRVLLAALLAVFLGRIVLTYKVFNDTFDESVHIIAGLEILQRGSYTYEAQHPPLGRLAVAVFPYYLAGLRLDEHTQLWGHGEWTRRDLPFFWKTLLLARAGNLIFAVIVFFFVYRWSSLLYGPWAGLAACLLASCSPTLIAHASLATLDISAAATVLMAAYFFWRWSNHPGLRYCLASSAAFSLAVLCKFSALFFLPPLALLYFLVARWRRWRQGGLIHGAAAWASLGRGGAFLLLFGFTVWAAYLFEVGTIIPPGHRFISPFHMGRKTSVPNLLLKAVGARPLPAHRFAQGIIDVLSHNEEGQKAYLLGHLSQHGWWYYFPVAVAVKSTLPMLLLVGIAIALFGLGRYAGSARHASYPLLAVAVVLGVSMSSNLNFGVRHVLAVYPFLAILASGVFAGREQLPDRRRALTAAALLLTVWHVGESVAAHPDYLAYFNEVARGREERFLLDSNLDWGQDLARLGRYVQQNKIGAVHLSYFGQCSPAKMGVTAEQLLPGKAEEGWTAISVNNLMGVANDRGDFAWLRSHKPVARVGKSIWVYYLPEGARGGQR